MVLNERTIHTWQYLRFEALKMIKVITLTSTFFPASACNPIFEFSVWVVKINNDL